MNNRKREEKTREVGWGQSNNNKDNPQITAYEVWP